MNLAKYIIIFLSFLAVGCTNLDEKSVMVSQELQLFSVSKSNVSYINYAATYVGYHEKTNRKEIKNLIGIDPLYTEWCSAFANAVLKKHGIPGSESVSDSPLVAQSFNNWGISVEDPLPGDIIIFRRGNLYWQGHVAFYIETVVRDNKMYYRVIGGNQSNSITIEDYPVTMVLSIRRPNNYIM